MSDTNESDWKIFQEKEAPHDEIERLPPPPSWRRFGAAVERERTLPRTREEALAQNTRGATFEADYPIVEMVNAALYLRRPLLLTGKPGSGKSSLIYAVARQLKLGDVLRWPITSRSTLKEGLYEYDAIGRLQQQRSGDSKTGIRKYLKLGPLGTALLPTRRPRALLIDEIDKSDIDLPNDLLNVFEEGEYRIPELERLDEPDDDGDPVRAEERHKVEIRDFFGERFPIVGGHVRCDEFPFVVLTSNGEREFPAPFLRRCLRFQMPEPDQARFTRIVAAHLGEATAKQATEMIAEFARRSRSAAIATDQLLNAVYIVSRPGRELSGDEKARVLGSLLAELVAAPVTPTTA